MTVKGRRPGVYAPMSWELVRAPLLPAEGAAAGRVSSSPDSLLPRDPLVRLAVQVATGDLAAALRRTPPGTPDGRRVTTKLLRYLIRMSTRPTPFGLFAGVGLSDWGSSTDLSLSHMPGRTRTRPDMEWIGDLVAGIEQDSAVRPHLRLQSSCTIVQRAGRAFLAGGDASAVSVRASGAVRRALELADTPITVASLVVELGVATGATPEKAARLVDELWRQGFFISELRPPLTGAGPTSHVAERLAAIPAAAVAAERFAGLVEAIEEWDELPLEDRAPTWPDVLGKARSAYSGSTARQLLQTDMALPLNGTHLHASVGVEAARAAELLLRLSPHPNGPPHLESYRRAFEVRFGADRDVPLFELLDPELGLGPPWAQEHRLDGPADSRRHKLLLDLALNADPTRSLVVELTDDLLAGLQTGTLDPAACPPTLDMSVFLAATSSHAIDDGDFMVVVGPNVGANSAGRHLGRFADLLGGRAGTGLNEVAAIESGLHPGRVQVEVVYLPTRGRAANVAVRPTTREFEVSLDTTPGVPSDRVVPLNELVVGVRNRRLRVRWPAAGSEIVAVQGHMLNVHQAPAAARFLLELAGAGRCQLSPFSWGPASTFPFLPRIQCGRVVLSLAQWRLDLTPKPPTSDELSRWREQWSVPSHVYLAAGDNRLLLDLDDPEHVELMEDELRKRVSGRSAIVQEALPGTTHAWLAGPHGGHICEVVVPIALRDCPEDRVSERRTRTADTVTSRMRLRLPGSDWLYVKLYGSRSAEDELIAGPLLSFGLFATGAGLASGWYFLRYADPEPHIRLRFRGEPQVLLGPLLRELSDWATELVVDETRSRFSIDTYEREVERFGGVDGMQAAETLFVADSLAGAELLNLSRNGGTSRDELTVATLSVDALLEGLGLGVDARIDLYSEAVTLAREDGDEYRQRKLELRLLLGLPRDLDRSPGDRALATVLARSIAALAPVAALLESLERENRLSRAPADLWPVYVHLHLNRLLGRERDRERLCLQLLRRTRVGLRETGVKRGSA